MTMFSAIKRDDVDVGSTTMSPTMANLLIALIVLLIFALLLVAGLLVLRHIRRTRKAAQEQLPMYNEKRVSAVSTNEHRLTITAAAPTPGHRESYHVYQEKPHLADNSSSPPQSPVPEIRITFPEEVDDAGKRQSGRVVVVKVGDHSIGMEPLQEDSLPPYQMDANDRFQSLDLDRIGGLKEKEMQ